MKIQVKVIAGAKQQKIEQMAGGGLKVHLTAIREKNKANQQLVELLAKHFNVSKSKVKIVRGNLASKKIVEIYD